MYTSHRTARLGWLLLSTLSFLGCATTDARDTATLQALRASPSPAVRDSSDHLAFLAQLRAASKRAEVGGRSEEAIWTEIQALQESEQPPCVKDLAEKARQQLELSKESEITAADVKKAHEKDPTLEKPWTTCKSSMVEELVDRALAAELAATPEDPCEVTLSFVHASPVKAPAFATAPACIKRRGSPLRLPDAAMKLVFAHNSGFGQKDNWRLCDGQGERELNGLLEKEGTVYVCNWNRVFRDAFPMDIELQVVGDDGRKLSDYISLARVFRNGYLVYSGNSGALAVKRLKIRGSSLLGRFMPFDAPISLRLLPSSVALPGDLVAPMEAAPATIGQKLALLAKKAAVAAVDDVTTRCAAKAASSILGLFEKFSTAVYNPFKGQRYECNGPLKPEVDKVIAAIDALRSAYEQLAADPHAPLAELKKYQETFLDGVKSGDVLGALKAVRDSIKADLNAAAFDAAELAQAIDAIIDALAKDLLELPSRIWMAVQKLAKDPAAQQELYREVIAALAAPPLPELTTNPPLLADEVSVDMKYRDYFQHLVLAAWSGVPVATTEKVQQPELNASNLIPFIDIYGQRFQGDGPDFRWGVGLAGFTETSTQTATDEDVYFRLGAQLNIGVGPAQVGVAYMFSTFWQDDDLRGVDALRVLVGADLVRLFSGSNQPSAAETVDTGTSESVN